MNVVFPGYTRTTGFDERSAAYRAAGDPIPRPAYRVDSVVPVVKALARLDVSSGPTGRTIHSITWNEEHGLGTPEMWIDTATKAGSA